MDFREELDNQQENEDNLDLDTTGPDFDGQVEDLLEEELEVLSGKKEKSAISRADSLRKVTTYLKSSYLKQFLSIDKISSSLQRVVKQGINSSIKEEVINAAHILKMLTITNPELKDLYTQFSTILRQLGLKSQHYDIRSACLETLCVFCFIFELEQSSFNDCFDTLKSIIKNREIEISTESECFVESTLDMFSVLLTKESDQDIVNDVLPDMLEPLIDLLEVDNVAVRLAASDAISLLVESLSFTEPDYTIDSLRGYCDPDRLIGILERSDLHQHKKIKKKDREKQRSSFKNTLQSLQTGSASIEQVNISGVQCTFGTQSEITKLNFFRNILGSGFLVHMQSNPYIHNTFDFSIPKENDLSEKSDTKGLNVATRERINKMRNLKVNKGRYNKLKKIAGESDDE